MSGDELLKLALGGKQEEWDKLHQLCLDRSSADRLRQALEKGTHQGDDTAAAWASVLQELHPGLKVNLPKYRGNDKGRALRILCAEDQPLICELWVKALSEAGHRPMGAADGQAAWEQIAADPTGFDVILTDHQMPRMDGLALVRKLREAGFAGRIVVVSGNFTPEIEDAYRALRVDRIVRKVMRPDFVVELIAGLF